MQCSWMGLVAAALLAPALAAKVPAAPQASDTALAVGTIVASGDNVIVGGWRELWSTDYATRTYSPGRNVVETPQCCVRVFGKGNALLVVKTDPVSRDAKGSPLTERVARKLWVTKRPGEVIADCEIFWLSTAVRKS